MVLRRGIADAGAVMKILLVVAAVVAAFIVLKLVFALVSALIGVLLFFGVLALLGFGAYTVLRLVTKGRRDRSVV
jgi:hypothetical protein